MYIGLNYEPQSTMGKRRREGAFYYTNRKDNVDRVNPILVFFFTGDIYTGQWVRGKKEGKGTYIYKESGATMVRRDKNDIRPLHWSGQP